jgi:hypothetical protein
MRKFAQFFFLALTIIVIYEIGLDFSSHLLPNSKFLEKILLFQFAIPALIIAGASIVAGIWRQGVSENIKVSACMTVLLLPPTSWALHALFLCFVLHICI